MANLTATLTNAANSFSAIEQAIQVVSNNTTNATTPGYATQTQIIDANSFDPSNGAIGGIHAGAILSSRDTYSEANVQSAQSQLNYSSTLSNHLKAIEPSFSLTTTSGSDGTIAGSLNSFFSSLSQLTVSPNDGATRQNVLEAGTNLASAFNSTYQALSQQQSASVSDVQSTVASINSIVSDVRSINIQKARDAGANSNGGLDAQLYSALESLSKLTNFTSIQAADGTTSIFLGGQSTLLVGNTQHTLQVAPTSGDGITGQVKIEDDHGTDVTGHAGGGTLGAVVQLANTTIPGYMTQLNNLASNVASVVNTQLAAGYDSNGNSGSPLFQVSGPAAAKTLSLTSITASQIAASSTSNGLGNGNAIALNNLQSAPVPGLNGSGLTQYFGSLSAQVGSDSANATNETTTQQQLLSQAQTMRANISGVSLDEQATLLTEYQQSYDATSKLVSVIAQMTQTLLGMISGTSA